MSSPFIRGAAEHRAERCRERAEQLRGIAEDPAMDEWREILLRLATSYDEMAGTDGDADGME